MVLRTTVQWILIKLNNYITRLLEDLKNWRHVGIPFAGRKFRLIGYESKAI
jgi:hypothetical protein